MGCTYLLELVFLFPLDLFPEVELLDYSSSIFIYLFFLGTSLLFFTVAAQDSQVYSFPLITTHLESRGTQRRRRNKNSVPGELQTLVSSLQRKPKDKKKK